MVTGANGQESLIVFNLANQPHHARSYGAYSSEEGSHEEYLRRQSGF